MHTPKELAEIEARHAKAPSVFEPYRVEEDSFGRALIGPDGFVCYLGEPEDCTWYRDGKNTVDELNKLQSFIAAARTDIPSLIATVRELRKLLDNPNIDWNYVEAIAREEADSAKEAK